jgi:hypothetical protein
MPRRRRAGCRPIALSHRNRDVRPAAYPQIAESDRVVSSFNYYRPFPREANRQHW